MHRLIPAIVILAWAATAARADVLFVIEERTGDIEVEGLRDEIDGVRVTPENIDLHIEGSRGYIARVGYDGIEWQRTERSSASEFYPWERLKDWRINPSAVPQALLDGDSAMALGSWAQAIADFRDVTDTQDIRPYFRYEALYKIGLCHAMSGNLRNAVEHFSRWPTDANSVWTPQALDLKARIHLNLNQFPQARESYGAIARLAKIPDQWKHKATLGEARVDVRERKYDEAKRRARGVAAATNGKSGMESVNALAEAIYGQAVVAANEAQAFPEVQRTLERAGERKDLEDAAAAELFATLGDVIYAQGRPAEARFAYMRVVMLYPQEDTYVAHSLQNAGQCFLDLSAQKKNEGDEAEADDLLIKGMKLLYQCAASHRGTPAGKKAAQTWTQNRSALKAAEARQAG